MSRFNHTNTLPTVQQVIDCNDLWFDGNGFLTKLPMKNGSYLNSLMPREGVTRVTGIRTYSNVMGNSATPSKKPAKPRTPSETPLRFIITDTVIVHELPRGRVAEITAEKISVTDASGRVAEIWQRFLNSAMEVVWRRTSVLRPVWSAHTANYVPLTMGALYNEVTHVIEKVMRRLGYGVQMDDIDHGGLESFRWIWKTSNLVTDSTDYLVTSIRYQRWHSDSINPHMYTAWKQLLEFSDLVRKASHTQRESTAMRENTQKLLRGMSIHMVALLDAYLKANPEATDYVNVPNTGKITFN